MIFRAKADNIIFEYTNPENPKGIILMCDGFPSVPKQKDFMEIMEKDGYMSVFPRYKGTWESEGEFLKDSPRKDIETIISYLKKGEILDLYSMKKRIISDVPIFAIGSSFGGSVAIELSLNENIKKSIALSPLIDFKRYSKWDLLKDFLKSAYSQAYRFSEDNWNNMINGKKVILDDFKSNKIYVICDINDDSIEAKETISWAEKFGVQYEKITGFGHISFSKVDNELWKIIKKVL